MSESSEPDTCESPISDSEAQEDKICEELEATESKVCSSFSKKFQSAIAADREVYVNRLADTLTSMMQTKTLCDTQIMLASGSSRPVHWAMISTLIPNLHALFTQTEVGCHTWLNSIADLTPCGLDVVVQLAYTGRVQLTMNNVQDVVMVASHLELYEIRCKCEDFLKDHVTVSNCIKLSIFAQRYQLDRLRGDIFKFILRNFFDVVQTNPDYLTLLTNDDLCRMLEDDLLNAPREEDIFDAILKWIDHDLVRRKPFFPNLVSRIRMGLAEPTFLTSKVLKHPYVKDMNRDEHDIAFGYQGKKKSRTRVPRTILMAVLGWSGGNTTPMIEAYDPRAKKWFMVRQRNLLPGRAYHGTLSMNGCIYVIGGFDGRSCFNSVLCFDTAIHDWSERCPMQECRCYVCVVSMDGNMYAMGGFNGDVRCRSVECYDARRNQWSFCCDMHERRSDASAAVHRGKIIICGGFDGARVLITAETYDVDANQWTLISSMLTPRSGHELVSFNGHLYAIAGFNGQNRMNSVERYDEVHSNWMPSVSILNIRSNFATAELEGSLYVIGGFNGTATFSSVERLDAEHRVWENAESLNIHRSALGVCALSDLENPNSYSANEPTLIVTLMADSSRVVHEHVAS